MTEIGPVDPEIWVVKKWSNWVSFENISRNMILTGKMIMTNIIGNFVAGKIGPFPGESTSSEL